MPIEGHFYIFNVNTINIQHKSFRNRLLKKNVRTMERIFFSYKENIINI